MTTHSAPGIGDNGMGAGHLAALIDRIEKLAEEKKAIADDIKEVYAEAKANGFDTATMRKIIAMRKLDDDRRREQQEILETYMHALGMLAELPLGQAAIKQATA